MLHKNLVQIGTVNSHMPCHVSNPYGVRVIIFHVFPGLFAIGIGIVPGGFQGGVLHKGKQQQEIAQRAKLFSLGFLEGIQQTFHTVQQTLDIISRIMEHKGMGKNRLVQNLRAGFTVKSHPGITPGLVFICLIVGRFFWGNEESIPFFREWETPSF